MDAGTFEPPSLDGFSLILPLPYRVAVILVAGVWAWGLNVQYLAALKIDVPALIRYPSRPSTGGSVSVHKSTYHLATLLTVPLAISLFAFWFITQGDPARVVSWEILPQSYLFLFVVLLALPLHHLSRGGRYRFLITLKRISLGGLAEAQDGKFGDIILADVLTSYSKVLGDLFVSSCMFISRDVSSTSIPNRECGGSIAVPLIISVPSIIRLRQCLIEFYRVYTRGSRHIDGWGGQHLANAAKYATALPVIALTMLQRNYDPAVVGVSVETLHKLWILACVVNSSYCFYWDIDKDWDLSFFSDILSKFKLTPPPLNGERSYPFGLRANRFFYANGVYYAAMVIDLILRFTWLSRLTTRLNWINDLESGVFFLMLFEVIRRWLWIFLRVETEWVRNTRGPAPDDILLGEFTKLDED